MTAGPRRDGHAGPDQRNAVRREAHHTAVRPGLVFLRWGFSQRGRGLGRAWPGHGRDSCRRRRAWRRRSPLNGQLGTRTELWSAPKHGGGPPKGGQA